MSFVHENSCECTKSELDLFAVPGTQTAVESSSTVEYNPVSALAHLLPIEFNIVASGESYIDLNNTQLYVRLKITKENGDDIAGTDLVGPVNLTLQSLFSEIEMKLNDTLITSSNGTYAYRSYLETLLSFGPAAKASQITAGLYYRDTPGSMNVTDPAGANTGLQKRAEFFNTGAVSELIGPLHLDMCRQERFIPSDVNVKIRLIRNKDSFCLMASGNAPTYRLVITDCKLYVRKVKLSPSIFIAHAKVLQTSNAKFPLKHVQVKSFTIATGQLDFSHENVLTGTLPSRMVVGFVDNSAYNGSYGSNPFNFKHYNLSELKLYIDGQNSLHATPMQPDYDNGLYIREYMSCFDVSNKLGRDEGLDLAREDYPRGFTLYGFDLTADLCGDGGHLQLVREGCIRLNAKFRTALPNTVNCIVYAEHESLLELDRSKNVIFDNSG